MRPLLLYVLLAAANLAFAGQDPKYRAPRTPDGRPDLQGVWNFTSGVPLQRPTVAADTRVFSKDEFDERYASMRNAMRAAAKFAPVEDVGFDWIDFSLHVDDRRTSLISHPENGRLPTLVEGVRRVPTVEDIIATLTDPRDGPPGGLLSLVAELAGRTRTSHEDFSMAERCLSAAPVPFQPAVGENYLQIIQAGDTIALLTDEFWRIITLDGNAAMGEKLRRLSGVSTGRWDGETLVVVTSHFDGGTVSFAGAGNSRHKVVTERFTRTSKTGLKYAATVIDPKTFTDKIELSFPMALVDRRLYESACHEGNYSLGNTLSAIRKEDETRKTP